MATLILAGVAAAGCGSSSTDSGKTGATSAAAKLTPVKLQLDWIPKEEYAPLYAGLKQGIFAKNGIDLHIETGKGSVIAMEQLSSGAADIAYVNVAAFVQAVGKGVKATAFYGQIQQDPTEILSWNNTPVHSIQALSGKSLVVSTTEGFAQYLPHVLQMHKVPASSVSVERVDVNAKGPIFASHKGDSMSWFQSVNVAPLEKQAHTTFVALPSQDWDGGALNDAENLVALNSYISGHADVLRRMATAMQQSWAWTAAHPSQAAQTLAPLLTGEPVDQITATIKKTLTLGYTTASKGHARGWMAPSDWSTTVSNLKAGGLAGNVSAPTSYYTNQYVP